MVSFAAKAGFGLRALDNAKEEINFLTGVPFTSYQNLYRYLDILGSRERDTCQRYIKASFEDYVLINDATPKGTKNHYIWLASVVTKDTFNRTCILVAHRAYDTTINFERLVEETKSVVGNVGLDIKNLCGFSADRHTSNIAAARLLSPSVELDM